MKDVIIALGCLISLGYGPVSAWGQAPEKKPANWVDVLQNDPRLKVKLRFKYPKMPTVEEVLDKLQSATGVSLSLAPQTERGQALFGSMEVHNAPAWKVMEQLAATQVEGGKWEKSGNGYVLHGKPRNFRTAERPKSKDGNEAPAVITPPAPKWTPPSETPASPAQQQTYEPRASGTGLGWWLVGGAVGLVVGAGVLAYRRSPRRGV